MPGLGVLRQGINRALRPLGLRIVRGYGSDSAIQPFLPARKTVTAARRAGVSVEDHIDSYSAAPGATAATVAEMLRLADPGERVSRVCEIGAGSGRYAARVITALRPDVYEVYETARDWLPRLRGLPNVVVQPTDGRTLRATATASVSISARSAAAGPSCSCSAAGDRQPTTLTTERLVRPDQRSRTPGFDPRAILPVSTDCDILISRAQPQRSACRDRPPEGSAGDEGCRARRGRRSPRPR